MMPGSSVCHMQHHVHSLTHVAATRIADIQTFIMFANQSALSLPEVGKKKHKAKKPKDSEMQC